MHFIGDIAEKLVLVLRDGRKLIGVLRSWDQFGMNIIDWRSLLITYEDGIAEQVVANIVLQDTIERNFVLDCYSDVSRGTFLVRGENVLLLGEVVRECTEALVERELAEC